MVKKMRKALDKAIRKLNEAESAVQVFASYIVFKGYDWEKEPRVGFVSESCVAITREDDDGQLLELSAEEAIILMEQKGCITPDDF